MPRFKPYTAIGIRRVPCIICGAPGHANWNICADKVGERPQFRVLCAEHDVQLNELVMRWAFGDTREDDLERYRRRVLEDAGPDGLP